MNKRMWWALIAGPGMAMVSLVLVFLVLGRSTAEATPGRMGTAPDLQPQTATFTVSGTVICQATGPLSGVEVYAWNQGTGLGDVKDVTDSSGAYRVTLEEGNYRLEFTPPPAAELNARAFTTTQILTDTILDVDFCVCSGAWVTETVDSDGNVGLCTSLALAPSYPYTPYIGYHDATSINLKLAWLSGTTWFSETVEHGGEGTSLALVPTYPYTPRIVHADWTTGWRLRYACRDGATWISMTVAGMRAADGSLALEPTYPYTPHVSYHNYCLFAENFPKSRIVYPPTMGVRTVRDTISGGAVWQVRDISRSLRNSWRFLSSSGKISGKNQLFGRNSRNSF